MFGQNTDIIKSWLFKSATAHEYSIQTGVISKEKYAASSHDIAHEFCRPPALIENPGGKAQKLLVISTKFIGPKHGHLSCKMSLGVVRSKDKQLYLQGKLGVCSLPISTPRPFSPDIRTLETAIFFMASWPSTYLYKNMMIQFLTTCIAPINIIDWCNTGS